MRTELINTLYCKQVEFDECSDSIADLHEQIAKLRSAIDNLYDEIQDEEEMRLVLDANITSLIIDLYDVGAEFDES